MFFNKNKTIQWTIQRKILFVLFLTPFFFFFKKSFLVISFMLAALMSAAVNYDVFFYCVFSFLTIWSSIMIFLPKNPVQSILYMISTFLNASFLILILGGEFISLIFILVYVGAIAMLFLFMVMMLDLKKDNLFAVQFKDFAWYNYFGYLLFGVILFEIYLLIDETYIHFNNEHNVNVSSNNLGEETFYMTDKMKEILFFNRSISALGEFLYTHYFVYLIFSGIILLIPLIGAIVLTFQDQEKVIDSRKKNLLRFEEKKIVIEPIDYKDD